LRRLLLTVAVLGVGLQVLAVRALLAHEITVSHGRALVGFGLFGAALSMSGLIGADRRALGVSILGTAIAIVTGLIVLFGG
jgi:hypothetical protein